MPNPFAFRVKGVHYVVAVRDVVGRELSECISRGQIEEATPIGSGGGLDEDAVFDRLSVELPPTRGWRSLLPSLVLPSENP
jgi:hypothetical protein